MTAAASCQCSSCYTANLDGPQSMSVKKCLQLWWAMSIASLIQLLFMLSFPFFQWTGAGSINQQISQALMMDLTSFLDTCRSTNLAKYRVRFMPGCPLWRWTLATWSRPSCPPIVVQVASAGSPPSFGRSSHLHGTLVRWSAQFWQDCTSAVSTVRSFSLMVSTRVASRLHISISLDALVVSRAFPLKASVIHRCMHTESVTMCRTLACHWRTRLTPFRVASSLARFMCLESFSGRSQQAPSTMNSSTARATPRASKLESTQTVNSFPSTHQFSRTGSSWVTLATVSISMLHRAALRTSLSHSDNTDVERCFMAATATQSQPHMGKWPSLLPLMCKPSTFAPSHRCSSSLHISQKLSTDRMPSFTKVSSM